MLNAFEPYQVAKRVWNASRGIFNVVKSPPLVLSIVYPEPGPKGRRTPRELFSILLELVIVSSLQTAVTHGHDVGSGNGLARE